METYLFVLRPHEVLDDMRGRCVAATVAEPLARLHTLDHAGGVGDAAVGAGVLGEIDVYKPLAIPICTHVLASIFSVTVLYIQG